MGTNRFESFKPIEFDLPIFKPDFRAIEQNLAGLQNEYDTGIDEINNRTFKNLEADDPRAQQKRIEQQQLIEGLTDTYAQDIGAGRAALSQTQRDIAADYNPGGEAYSMQKNLDAFQTWDKEQGELVKKGTISTESHELARKKVLADFKKIGGTKEGQYGYNTISTLDINAYVNRWDTADKIGKDWSATIFENYSPEEGEKASVWLGSDGFINTKNERIRKTVQKDMMEGILRGMFDDDKLMGYENQIDMLRNGQTADHSEWTFEDPDTGELKWDLTNPFVKTAWDVTKKRTIHEHSIKRGKTRDPLYVAQQKRGWKKQDELEERTQESAVTHTSSGNVNTHPVTNRADNKKRIRTANDTINRLEQNLEDAKAKGSNASPAQIQQIRRELADAVSTRDNYAKTEERAIAEIAPDVAKYDDQIDTNINFLMQATGKTADEIKDIMAAVKNEEKKNSGFFGNFDLETTLAKAMEVEGNDAVQALRVYGAMNSKEQYLASKDDQFADWYANNDDADNTAPVQVGVRTINELGSKGTETLHNTPIGAANAAVKGLPNNLMFSDPNGVATYLSGDDFKTKIEASTQFKGATFYWDQASYSQYQKFSTLDENGNDVQTKRGIVSVKYKPKDSQTTKIYTIYNHLDNESSISGLIEKDLREFSGPTATEYLNNADAQFTDAGASFKIAGDSGQGGKVAVKTTRKKGQHTVGTNYITWEPVTVAGANTEYSVNTPTTDNVRFDRKEDAIVYIDAYNSMVWDIGKDASYYKDGKSYVENNPLAKELIDSGVYKQADIIKLYNLHK